MGDVETGLHRSRVAVLLVTCLLLTVVSVAQRRDQVAPIVIAHRGASGYLPEHTLAAYERAIDQGADYIEPDLVSTRDGVLIARHEVNITDTTDVADRKEFAGRRTTKTIDGAAETGWFADDFTLAEIRTLRAKQRLPFRSQAFNGQYPIPTFDEVIALAQRRTSGTGGPIGIYPETKHPTYHEQRGLGLESKLLASLQQAGWNREDAPVFIQSFEIANLRALRQRTAVRLIQLIDFSGGPYDLRAANDPRGYADLLTPAGLQGIARYADGIGLNKRHLVDETGRPMSEAIVRRAHELGLLVHVWTFRNEPLYLASAFKGNPAAEYQLFFTLGVDGVFTDFPDTAVSARREHASR